MVRGDKSNAIILYNPIISIYYCPPVFCLYESRLPITKFPNSLPFDWCLTCSLLRDLTGPIHEPFPPGTRVYIQHNGSIVRGTINNIPLPVLSIIPSSAFPPSNTSGKSSQSSEITDSPPYVIILDLGITAEQYYDNMIKSGHDDVYPSRSSGNSTDLEGIPHFLRHDSKFTTEHKK